VKNLKDSLGTVNHLGLVPNRYSLLRKSLLTAGAIILCFVVGAWFLLGLADALISTSGANVVGVLVSLVLGAIPAVALFLAWMRWGPWWNASRRIHWICRRTFGAAN
jgi:hypothetical protein